MDTRSRRITAPLLVDLLAGAMITGRAAGRRGVQARVQNRNAPARARARAARAHRDIDHADQRRKFPASGAMVQRAMLRVLVLLVLAAPIDAAAELTVRLQPSDCVGTTADAGDCYRAIEAAVGKCRVHGAGSCRIVLAPGRYTVACPPATRTSSTQTEAPGVLLANLVGPVSFGGVAALPRPELLVDYSNGGCAGIVAENCSDVTVQHLTIDALRLPAGRSAAEVCTAADAQPPADEQGRAPRTFVVQRYLDPLLLRNRKFDVRVYLLVASQRPMVAFWRGGYCRRALMEYDADAPFTPATAAIHLTNTHQQRGRDGYIPEDHIWSLGQLRDYIADARGPAALRLFERRWAAFIPAACRVLLAALLEAAPVRPAGCLSLRAGGDGKPSLDSQRVHRERVAA